jgi:peptide-methionine (S)-S-oxide reductase
MNRGSRRNILCTALLVGLVALASSARAQPAAKNGTWHDAGPTDHAYFAMGCFWSAEVAFEGIKGVRSVTSGYTGGSEAHPSYEEVSSGTTGHFESIDIAYDPAVISYAKLLDTFWHNIDPTQADGQFCDRGSQYRTAIFYRDSVQARTARESRQALERSVKLGRPIVTLMRPIYAFWPAEEYHQDFFKKEPEHYHAYRQGCGRDRRLEQLYGKDARRGSVPH